MNPPSTIVNPAPTNLVALSKPTAPFAVVDADGAEALADAEDEAFAVPLS